MFMRKTLELKMLVKRVLSRRKRVVGNWKDLGKLKLRNISVGMGGE